MRHFKPLTDTDQTQAVANNTPLATPIPLQVGTGLVLTVGAGMEFATLGDACKAAVNGDTIAVKAGTYVNDFATVTSNIRIVSLGGIVNEVATQAPTNDKGLITVDANLAIQGFTFTGGFDGSPDGNVSGIRLESGSLYVNYCYFHDMQEGLLANPDPTANVIINHSEFARNGSGDGYSHNIYVGAVASLTILNSYFHDANVGHEIKSRAAVTNIFNNVIADGPNGTASYDIDAPNGGVVHIAGNLIEKGPNALNWYVIHYGGETQYAYANNSLTINGNTILNDLGANGCLLANQSDLNGLSTSAAFYNNRIYGFSPSQIAVGAITLGANLTLGAEPTFSTASPWTAVPDQSISTGAQLLRLTTGGHTITGGEAALTVNDLVGNNVIQGGAGGVAVISPGWDMITTQAGAHDAITINGRNNTVNSAGADHVSAQGYYQTVTATGQASITGSGFNNYNLNGTGEFLTASGGGVVNVGAGGGAAITDTGSDVLLTVAGGAVAVIRDLAGASNGAPASLATVRGGGVTGGIHNNGAITLTTSDAGASVTAGTGALVVTGGMGADTLTSGVGTAAFYLGSGTDLINFGGGATSVAGGTGADTYNFTAGQHANAMISGFKAGADVVQFSGFSGTAIQSETTANGNTSLVLSDGSQITFLGVQLAALKFRNAKTVIAANGNATLGGAGADFGHFWLPAAEAAAPERPAIAFAPLPEQPGLTFGTYLPDAHTAEWGHMPWHATSAHAA